MIYLDNAATTAEKPPCVIDAVEKALRSFGSVGRGVHGASLAAGESIYQARCLIARLFGIDSSSRVAFTLNATEALNIAISSLLPAGRRAITSAASHNSVLRPLYRACETKESTLEVIPIGPDGSLDWAAFEAAAAQPADLVVMTHASNVTGDVYDVARMAELAHRAGAVFVLDVAQTAGLIPIDMTEMGVDVLAFSGHKALYGPQGTGGLVVRKGLELAPFKVGGSGIDSFNRHHPQHMPESLEAGTLNAHGIAGLAAGVSYLLERGIAQQGSLVAAMEADFRKHLAAMPAVIVYGGGEKSSCSDRFPHGLRTGVVALNLTGTDSSELAGMLANEFDICTRAGAHCAPLMHEALGTAEQGVVRFSFSAFNTHEEMESAVEALHQIAARLG